MILNQRAINLLKEKRPKPSCCEGCLTKFVNFVSLICCCYRSISKVSPNDGLDNSKDNIMFDDENDEWDFDT
jgi:hypothetical protein